MSNALGWLILILATIFLPPLAMGVIRKTKARLQNRIGASLYQPLQDLIKLFRKYETVSEHASAVLRASSVAVAVIAVLLSLSAPWCQIGAHPPHLIQPDVFLIAYLFVLYRFATVLGSLDTSSQFAGFGASREITIPVLLEPGFILCLASLALASHTTDLSVVFSFENSRLNQQVGLWLLAGCGVYMSALIELSRMPADDPTTHLELTMVHEAMLIENSGPNLGLIEYAYYLKLLILMGLSGQCFLRAIPAVWTWNCFSQTLASVAAVLAMLLLTAVIEASAVKLRWTKLPEFIAYAVTFGLLCAISVVRI